MVNRSWVAALIAPFVLAPAAPSRAEEASQEPPKIVAVDARPEAGRTLIRISTTSGSVNYISYNKSPTLLVVDIYGLEAGAIPASIPVGSPEVRSIRFDYSPPVPGTTAVARFIVERTSPGPTPIRVEGDVLVLEARTASAGSAAAPRPVRRQPAPLPADGELGPAHRIDEIVTEAQDSSLSVIIRGDGKIRYDSFTLKDPPRLVVDVHGVENHVARGQFPIAHPAVGRIRVSQFQMEPDKVARVVFDLGTPDDYRIATRGTELRIGFGAAAMAALERDDTSSPSLPIEGDAVSEAAAGSPPMMPSPSSPTFVTAGEAQVHGLNEEEEGTLISLDLKDADIKDVLRYFSEISGLNIILDPDVKGVVTVRLIDVPWNKALDIILKSHGYGKNLDGNVLRIAEVRKLTNEETEAAALALRQLEARPLVTITRPISYGNASEIAAVVEKTALSRKGSIIIDQRTNTLIIQEVDLPDYRQRILELIKTLDSMTPQVEIEARIVETTTGWSRSFGIQWGFTHAFDASTGSTTDFTFPNSGIINGGILGPNGSAGGFGSELPSRGWAVNLPSSGANGAISFHLANITDQFQLDLALSALENENKARVLSAPRITTQSNIRASIRSGLSIPVQTIANNTITVTYQSALLELNVTPQVTAENTVILKVTVDDSQPGTGTVGITALPPINQRRAETTVLVPDGGTAVIGGVFVINESNQQSRIPVLYRLPVFGNLFKNKSLSRNHDELLIFITPKIKRPTSVASAVVPISVNPSAQ